MPYLTRKQMEAVIASGASVMLPRGGIATRVEELPTEAALARYDAEHAEEVAKTAKDNPVLVKLAQTLSDAADARGKSANDELKAKIASLQAELEAAKAQDKPVPAPAPAPATPPPAPVAPAAVKVAPLPEPKVEPAKAPEKAK